MVDNTSSPTRRPGRPRDPRIDEAVLVAARELLGEVGYQRLTYDAVAQRAGVHRPAVYRRWPSKLHLVLDACREAITDSLETPNSGNLADDIRFLIASTVNLFSLTYVASGMAGALAEVAADQSMIDEFVRGYSTDAFHHFTAVINEYRTKGEVGDVNAGLLFTMITGTVFMRVATMGQDSGTAQLVDGLTEVVLAACRP